MKLIKSEMELTLIHSYNHYHNSDGRSVRYTVKNPQIFLDAVINEYVKNLMCVPLKIVELHHENIFSNWDIDRLIPRESRIILYHFFKEQLINMPDFKKKFDVDRVFDRIDYELVNFFEFRLEATYHYETEDGNKRTGFSRNSRGFKRLILSFYELFFTFMIHQCYMLQSYKVGILI